MKFDVVSVFPEFFDVLGLSLVGKAQEAGLIHIQSHDLRDWTHDVHRTVDDSPFGGGAGMVMKPDVWAEAIDAVTDDEPFVLAIPTPSGEPFTQRIAEKLATQAKHIVIACGRYEGIDARVAEYYAAQPGVTVVEYSLGDYVLNGGEVAAVALIEAVGRLLPGMVGNPESLIEESHGAAGLLEYPVYTRPKNFRGVEVPEVLTSGNHGAVAQWRRERSFDRTILCREEMMLELDPSSLSKKDLAYLATKGYFVSTDCEGHRAQHLTKVLMRRARPEDAYALSALACRTFPDAAPSYLSHEDMCAFIDEHLQERHFNELLAAPRDNVLVVAERCDRGGYATGEIIGYSWVIIPQGDQVAGEAEGAPVDFVTADGVRRDGPLMYLEKAYLDRQWRGSGMFKKLMDTTLNWLCIELSDRTFEPTASYLWLGTNKENRRAQRAYRRYGFEKSGERIFYVGEQINNDVTMCMRLDCGKIATLLAS